jgi:mannose-6-phosphate isomerase-like protein (cupin superfamily)
MPVYEPGQWLSEADRPEWCEISSIGRFSVPTVDGRFERHHHEVHEVWMLHAGKARIVVDGAERYVQGGDIVLTRAGEEHDIVEVYEDLHGFFLETGLPLGGSGGHRGGVAHPVPAAPVPADFPTR